MQVVVMARAENGGRELLGDEGQLNWQSLTHSGKTSRVNLSLN